MLPDSIFGSPVLTEVCTKRRMSFWSPTTPTSYSGSRVIGTRERLDLGVLGVAGATIDDASAAARFITLELAGQVRRYPGWLEWTTPKFEIEANEPVDIGIDGEALTMDPPLVFEALPGALLVRLPAHATGQSPAARAVHLVSRSTIVDLVRIVGGVKPATSR